MRHQGRARTSPDNDIRRVGKHWGFLLVTDKTITSMDSNVIGMRASPDGNYQTELSMNTNFNMSSDGGLPGSVNLTSWDWNEYTQSFIVVRSGSSW
jgi:hypothetical protein